MVGRKSELREAFFFNLAPGLDHPTRRRSERNDLVKRSGEFDEIGTCSAVGPTPVR
jgi:hypothetical protein